MLQFELLKETLHGCFEQADAAFIQQHLGLSYLLQSHQIHGTEIHIVENPSEVIPPCDALITSLKGVGLMIKHADCQAALFYDPVNQVIAAVHAGWKGSVGKIYTKTVQVLKEKFKSRPEDLLVGISPSLGKEHAEFINYQSEFPENFWSYQVKPNYFDFWRISLDELLEVGLLPHHIQFAGKCTYANQEYYSYRRNKTTERMGSVIALKNLNIVCV